MRVDIEDVLRIRKERSEINKVDLEDIEWYREDCRLYIDPELIKEFKYVGLSNCDFIDERGFPIRMEKEE